MKCGKELKTSLNKLEAIKNFRDWKKKKKWFHATFVRCARQQTRQRQHIQDTELCVLLPNYQNEKLNVLVGGIAGPWTTDVLEASEISGQKASPIETLKEIWGIHTGDELEIVLN